MHVRPYIYTLLILPKSASFLILGLFFVQLHGGVGPEIVDNDHCFQERDAKRQRFESVSPVSEELISFLQAAIFIKSAKHWSAGLQDRNVGPGVCSRTKNWTSEQLYCGYHEASAVCSQRSNIVFKPIRECNETSYNDAPGVPSPSPTDPKK